MMATQETAEYYWQRYCYAKDLDRLDHAYDFIKGRLSSIALIPALLKRMMENIIFITPICTSTFGRVRRWLMTCPWQEGGSWRLSRPLNYWESTRAARSVGLTAGTIWRPIASTDFSGRGMGRFHK